MQVEGLISSTENIEVSLNMSYRWNMDYRFKNKEKLCVCTRKQNTEMKKSLLVLQVRVISGLGTRM